MKKAFLIPLLLCITSTLLVAQDDAKAHAILDKTSTKYKLATSQLDFTLNIEDTKTEKKQLVKGSVVIKDKKFKLTVPTVQTYYDGKTQYVYMLKNKEVSISTPNFEELQAINPAYILSSYTKQSSVQFSMDNKPNLPYYIIDVFPDFKAKKEYYKVIVWIDKKTNNLITIRVLNKNGIHTLLKVLNYKTNLKYDDTFFVFDFKANPKAIVNDLR